MKQEPKKQPTPSILLDCAHLYVKKGWHTMLLGDGGTAGAKKPRQGSRGCYDATLNLDVIDDGLTRYPNANIGIATGEASNLIVLDIDEKYDGPETLKMLEEKLGMLPETVRVNTGGGGFHLYFEFPDCFKNRKIKGKLGEGIDVKANGGYVVTEPSIHPNGRGYFFDLNNHPGDIEAAKLPEEWCNQILVPEKAEYESSSEYTSDQSTAYGRKALTDECQKVSNAPLGQQEDTLNNAALKIGGLVKAGEIAYNEGFDALFSAARYMANDPEREPWTDSEITKKIKRAFQQANVRTIQHKDSGMSVEKSNNKPMMGPHMNFNKIIAYTDQILSTMEFSPTSFIVPSLILVGLTILAGDPKLGKSWFALLLCKAFAAGLPFLV